MKAITGDSAAAVVAAASRYSAKARRQLTTDRDLQSYNADDNVLVAGWEQGSLDAENRDMAIGMCSTGG